MSNPTYDPEFHPDFVILGFRRSADEVEVWASNDLTRAELQALMHDEYPESVLGRVVRPLVYGYELRAGLRTFLLIRAPTYSAALRALMDQWNPDQPPEQKALTQSRPELER